MQQHVSKYFAGRRSYPSPLGMGLIGQNSTFLEHGCAAYQIKANCNNMVANILPTDPKDPRGMGSKDQNSTFSEHGQVAY